MHRHAFDPFSFVFGAPFAGLGLAVLLAGIDLTGNELRWVWPAVVIALGGLMLVGAAARGRSRVPAPPQTSTPGTGGAGLDDDAAPRAAHRPAPEPGGAAETGGAAT